MSADVEALVRQCRAAAGEDLTVAVLAQRGDRGCTASMQLLRGAVVGAGPTVEAALTDLRDRLAMQRLFAEAQAKAEAETAWLPRSLRVVSS